jgi:hypothetical protein
MWGWLFDFCNTCWFWEFENIQNQRIVGFRYLKISESKNYRVWVFEKKSDSKNHQLHIFQNLKKKKSFLGFMKKTDKDLMIF